MVNADGTVTGIYCHWDGYLLHNGMILNESYTDRQKVEALMALGDLSSLDHELGEKHDFNDSRAYKGQCNAYGRDRGENGCEAKKFLSIEEFVKSADDCHGEHVYIFDQENKWKIVDVYSSSKILMDVEYELKLIKESSF